MELKKIRRVAVYLGATLPSRPEYVDAVVALGTFMAEHELTLVYGGSNEGTMTVLADAFQSRGGKAVGVFTDKLPMEYLRPGLAETHVASTISDRKAMMFSRADAVIALPGSYGTWDELFDALELAKIDVMSGRKPKPIGVLNVDGYFDHLLAFVEHSVKEGFTKEQYGKLLRSGRTVEELFEALEAEL